MNPNVAPDDGERTEPHPQFAHDTPPGGYVWWYVDALSDDGRYGLTLIAFVGSVFSPYYARARRSGLCNPLDHCALNISLYGPHSRRWAMTERTESAVTRTPDTLVLGPSVLAWNTGRLRVHIDEVSVPIPTRIRGEIELQPAAITNYLLWLDPEERHHGWRPLAPTARISVRFSHPALRWQGHAYFDSNFGDVPLEDSFAGWRWSRATLKHKDTVVHYDVERRTGEGKSIALRFNCKGDALAIEPRTNVRLPPGYWGVQRVARVDPDRPVTVSKTLEDTPFYTRSLLNAGLLTEDVSVIHESLSLDRFRSRWVQALLPFRMPRRTQWS